MRAQYAAALANVLLILAIALGLTIPESSSSVVHAYSNPTKAAITRVLFAVMIASPLAIIVFWRTWVHAQAALTGATRGWRGVFEAAAMGFALTLPFVLPAVIVRQFNPGQWGQPQAFLLGLAYVGAYGLIGVAAGLVVGFVLWVSATVVLMVHRRVRS